MSIRPVALLALVGLILSFLLLGACGAAPEGEREEGRAGSASAAGGTDATAPPTVTVVTGDGKERVLAATTGDDGTTTWAFGHKGSLTDDSPAAACEPAADFGVRAGGGARRAGRMGGDAEAPADRGYALDKAKDAVAPRSPDMAASTVVAARATGREGGLTPPPAKPIPVPERQAGVLTAGSWDDTRAGDSFAKHLGRIAAGQHETLKALAPRLGEAVAVVTVRDGRGRPVAGVQAVLPSDRPGPVSRADGRLVLDPAWDGLEGPPARLTLRLPGGAIVEAAVTDPAGAATVIVPVDAVPVTLVDLALVIDTTGSMGDEIAYLKRELADIVAAVADRHPGVAFRLACVAYRDTGDDYLTMRCDFTADRAVFQDFLDGLAANGGGDGPEAVDDALVAAGKLAWSSPAAGTVRLLVHVADAPPHLEEVAPALEAGAALRGRGVGIYPVACSGVEDVAELTFRWLARATAARYLFVTDDSGVGGSHAEPHIPYYHVEKLTGLLTRLLEGEVTGRYRAATTAEIVRTSGAPPVSAPEFDASTSPVGKLLAGAGPAVTATKRGDDTWLLAWDAYETVVVVAGDTATVETRPLMGEPVVRYTARVLRTADGTLGIDAHQATVTGPWAGRWSPDSFAIAPDGSVRSLDDIGQAGAGTGVAGETN